MPPGFSTVAYSRKQLLLQAFDFEIKAGKSTWHRGSPEHPKPGAGHVQQQAIGRTGKPIDGLALRHATITSMLVLPCPTRPLPQFLQLPFLRVHGHDAAFVLHQRGQVQGLPPAPAPGIHHAHARCCPLRGYHCDPHPALRTICRKDALPNTFIRLVASASGNCDRTVVPMPSSANCCCKLSCPLSGVCPQHHRALVEAFISFPTHRQLFTAQRPANGMDSLPAGEILLALPDGRHIGPLNPSQGGRASFHTSQDPSSRQYSSPRMGKPWRGNGATARCRRWPRDKTPVAAPHLRFCFGKTFSITLSA